MSTKQVVSKNERILKKRKDPETRHIENDEVNQCRPKKTIKERVNDDVGKKVI